MTTPINSELSISVSVPDAIVDGYVSEGFPVYPMSVGRFNHTQVPYKNIYQSYGTISAYNGQTLDAGIPSWLKEVISAVDTSNTDPQPLLVRETHNSRFFYINVTVTTA